jgi:hypothetical protein
MKPLAALGAVDAGHNPRREDRGGKRERDVCPDRRGATDRSAKR